MFGMHAYFIPNTVFLSIYCIRDWYGCRCLPCGDTENSAHTGGKLKKLGTSAQILLQKAGSHKTVFHKKKGIAKETFLRRFLRSIDLQRTLTFHRSHEIPINEVLPRKLRTQNSLARQDWG